MFVYSKVLSDLQEGSGRWGRKWRLRLGLYLVLWVRLGLFCFDIMGGFPVFWGLAMCSSVL